MQDWHSAEMVVEIDSRRWAAAEEYLPWFGNELSIFLIFDIYRNIES